MLLAAMVSLVTIFAGGVPALADDDIEIALVVKILGIAWFERSQVGLEQFNADNPGVHAFMVGPSQADAAEQVQIVEDIVSQGVDVMCVIPIDAKALEPVLERAREKGIVVMSTEGSDLQNIDYDIEGFDNKAYGEHIMEELATLMGGEGEYALTVAQLTAPSHMEWMDAAEAYQREKYPDMIEVCDRVEDNDDQQEAYEKVRELLKTYPNLKGIGNASMPGNPGAALAIEEMNLNDTVSLVGTSLVSVSGKFLESGAADWIMFWDPAAIAYAMCRVGKMIHDGHGDEVVEGFAIESPYPGYDNMHIEDKILVANAWIDVTSENMGDYDY